MKNFTDKLNRLKTELSLSMDKDVAEFLGLTKSAFAERKRRGVFPEEALRLADLSHPELKLNVEYILTGRKDFIREFLEKERKSVTENLDPSDFQIEELFFTPKDANTYVLINLEEIELLTYYRKSDSKGKTTIFDVAKMSKDLSLEKLKQNERRERNLLCRSDYTEENDEYE